MAGGGGGNLWVVVLVVGCALVGGGMALEHAGGPTWLLGLLLAVGGLSVVFGSCEAMIKCVEGLAERSVGMEALDQLAMEHLLGVR